MQEKRSSRPSLFSYSAIIANSKAAWDMRPCTQVHTHLLLKSGMVVHAYNLNTKAEAAGGRKAGYSTHRDFETILGYYVCYMYTDTYISTL